ncbi:hypothetical protein Taro_044543 [Colocasia esculenta]|uniref:DUF630 domain-containing protein n=1 Tax=Colocasia esculenta TaxID=4460 RepID=A0A843X2X6_COLES|nr:hypothetical protein [Colocasia esculenta]
MTAFVHLERPPFYFATTQQYLTLYEREGAERVDKRGTAGSPMKSHQSFRLQQTAECTRPCPVAGVFYFLLQSCPHHDLTSHHFQFCGLEDQSGASLKRRSRGFGQQQQMGCWQSRVERDETVSICKARRGYMKQVVKGRQDFATAHLLYLRSLRDTGASLVQFADAESHLPHHLPPLLPSPPPTPPPPPRARAPKSQPPPPSDTVSSVRRPPPCSGSQFPVPFTSSAPPAAKEDGEEEDEEEAATVVPKMAVATSIAAVTPSSITVLSQFSKDPTSELTMVVSRKRKDLAEIVRELDEFFDKAAEAGNLVAMLFETQNCQVSSARGQKGKCSSCTSLQKFKYSSS